MAEPGSGGAAASLAEGDPSAPSELAGLTERVEALARRIDALAASLTEVERVLGEVGDAVVDAVATIGRRVDGLEIGAVGMAAGVDDDAGTAGRSSATRSSPLGAGLADGR